MTYGVPYSFVPGTKAKADEVNANFIDVLNKIEDTNIRITETNSQTQTNISELNTTISTRINEVEANCANTSLSNLDTTGQGVINSKANQTDLDDPWSASYTTVAYLKAIAPGQSHSYSLASYLPSGSKFVILGSLVVDNTINNASYAILSITTDANTNTRTILKHLNGTASNAYACADFVTLVGGSKTISLSSLAAGKNNANYTLRLFGYRKVR